MTADLIAVMYAARPEARSPKRSGRYRDQGTGRRVSERWTVGRWLTYWVENIAAPPHVAENTISDTAST
jgi:hypothetical protein